MLKNPLLTRYWFVFEENKHTRATSLSMGITAYSYDDAISIIEGLLFKDSGIPAVKSYIENFDVSTITDLHIRPNLLPSTFRGIWYPGGFSILQTSPVFPSSE